MAFQKFENRHTRIEERITVTKSNSIGFPSRFYHDNSIENFKFVVLFWDAEIREIGIHFTTNEAEKNGFAIAKSKIGYGGSVSARSFFRHYKIDTKACYGRYEWRKETHEGIGDLFIIKLVDRK